MYDNHRLYRHNTKNYPRQMKTKNNESVRHHYLPVFYLKGFTNEGETFFVYDKVTKKIIPNQPPKNHFFVKNLNTLNHNGEKKLNYEESHFGSVDSRASILLKKICSPDFINEEQLPPLERFQILSFIQSLYWRSPFRDEIYCEIAKKEGVFNKYFGISTDSEEVPQLVLQEIAKDIIDNPEFIKAFKHVIPSTSGTEELWNLFHKWKFITVTVNEANFIIGDDPFLINNSNLSSTNIFEELVIPISKKHLLILSNQAPNFIDSVLYVQINLSIFIKAKRFVASNNEKWLKELAAFYDLSFRDNKLNEYPSAAFKKMHALAKFSTYESYAKAYSGN